MCANPLPAGRYAITIFDTPKGAVHAFAIWADNEPGVAIVSQGDVAAPSGQNPGVAAIFTVSQPTLWNQTIWGCPNVADPKLTLTDINPGAGDTSLWSLIFGAGSKPPGSGGTPTWVYFGVGAVILLALSPMLFEVSKAVAVHEEKAP